MENEEYAESDEYLRKAREKGHRRTLDITKLSSPSKETNQLLQKRLMGCIISAHQNETHYEKIQNPEKRSKLARFIGWDYFTAGVSKQYLKDYRLASRFFTQAENWMGKIDDSLFDYGDAKLMCVSNLCKKKSRRLAAIQRVSRKYNPIKRFIINAMYFPEH